MIEHLVNLICSGADDAATLRQVAELTAQIPPGNELELLEGLNERANDLENAQPAAETAITKLTENVKELTDATQQALSDLYLSLGTSNNVRNSILGWLGNDGRQESLKAWCELITTSPPSNPHGLVQTFAPLVKRSDLPQWLFEELSTKGIAHPEIAAASLDLMNFHHRAGNLDSHPAQSRSDQLTSLLGSVVQQMARVEEGNLPSDLTPQEISERVSESVALTISLCDALALMEHEPAVGKLRQALELRHRRIQTEAAAALARLDVEEGREWLAKLVEEPIARLRVLSFAEELGILDNIPDEFQSEIAIAESKLAIWLSEPKQMGIAPSSMELVDNRELYWPSYEHPVQCYLFRFRYGSNPVYSNLGISGPLIHVFPNNIESLSVEDAYAAFAGWQAIHPKIFQMTPERAETVYSEQLAELKTRIEEKGFEDTKAVLVGSFFDELVLVSEAKKNDQTVIALADESDVYCFTSQSESDQIDAPMAYTIWRGRRFLKQFND